MSLPWSSKGSKGTPIAADELMIIDSADANPSTQNKRITIGTLPTTEITTWTANHDAAGFDLLNAGGITINNPADSFQYIVTPGAITADRILNIPVLTSTDTLVTQIFAQTISNKTFNNTNDYEDDGLVIQNPADTFNYSFQSAAIAADRIVSLPLLLGNDTLVTEAFAQTLTNKTLDDFSNDIHANIVHIQVRNETGGLLTLGDVVYISGFSGANDLPLVSLADASSSATMPAVGIVTSNISDNTNGDITTSGQLLGPSTTGLTPNATLYVSETTGEFTDVKPTGTALIQNIGSVLKVGGVGVGIINVVSISRTNDIPNIPSAQFWLGNASAVGTPVSMSSDATMDNTGALTVANNAITDAKTATFTTTKITTLNKALLNTEIVYDDQANTFGSALKQTFTHASGGAGIGLAAIAGDVSAPNNGEFWYNSSTGKFRARENGATVDLIGGPLTPWTSDIDAAGFDLLNVGGITINNPADTFQYIITPAAIVADRILNLPLMTGTDAFVLNDFAATLTNKILGATNTVNAALTWNEFRQTFNPNATIAGINVGGHTANPSVPVDGDIWYNSTSNQIFGRANGTNVDLGAAAGGAPPFADSSSIVEGSVDPTKEIRFEVDGLTTATTRVITPPDANITLVNTSDGLITNTNVDAAAAIVTSKLADAANFVLINQANTYGDFAQTFADNQLFIQNPAATFEFQISAPGIAADRTITLPLLIGNDTFVTEAFAQTLTNKTIDGDDNTIVDINETQQNVSVGASGTILTSNGVGLPPTYQTGVSQTPWTSDIDADGFNLQDISNIEFRNPSSGVPAGTVHYIALASNGDMQLNVASGDGIDLDFNGAREYNFTATVFSTLAANIDLGGGDMTNISTLSWGVGESITLQTNDMVFDVTTGNTFNFDINSVNEYIFDATQVDFNANNIFDMGNILFTTTLGAPGNTLQAIWADTSGIRHNVPTSDTHLFKVNGSDKLTISTDVLFSTNANLIGSNLLSPGNIQFFGSGTTPASSIQYITGVTAGFIFNVPSGDTMDFTINAVSKLSLELNEVIFNSQAVRGAGSYRGSPAFTPTTGVFRHGNTETSSWRNAGNTQNITLGVNASDELVYQMVDDTASIVLEANHTTPANAQVISQIDSVDDDSVGTRRIYSQIETRITDPTTTAEDGEQYFRIMKAGSLADYIILNDQNTDDITMKKIVTVDSHIRAGAGTIPSFGFVRVGNDTPGFGWDLAGSGSGYITINASDEFAIYLNGFEYDFGKTDADWKANNLINVGLLNQKIDNATAIHEMEANHTTPADAQVVGQIDFIDDNSIGGRETYGQIRTLIQDPTSTTEDGEMFLSVMKTGTLTDYISINEADSGVVDVKTDFTISNTNAILNLPDNGTIRWGGFGNRRINNQATGFIFEVETGDSFLFQINSADALTLDATDLTLAGTVSIAMGSGQNIEWAASANRRIANDGGGFTFEVETGDTFDFEINSVPEYTFDAIAFTSQRRIEGNQGADIASADAITLTSGNYFDITGTTTINHIINTDWQAGSVVILQTDASVTLTHVATGATGAEADMFLAGAIDASMTADDTITLVYDGVFWRETARSVN